MKQTNLLFSIMIALFVIGCSSFEDEPVSILSVSPTDGITIEAVDSIVIEFTDVPEKLRVFYRFYSDSQLTSITDASLDGQIVTIRSPLEYIQDFKDFSKRVEAFEIHLLWGNPDEEYTHILKYNVQPSWSNYFMTISVGNYQTGSEMLDAMSDSNIVMSRGLDTYFTHPNFPMPVSWLSAKKKSVDIAFVYLSEAGFSEPVTLKKIWKRFSKLGYRPLTFEEVVELRLQFYDLPPSTEFITLLSENDMRFMRACVDRNTDFGALVGPCGDDGDIEESWYGTFLIFNSKGIVDLNWQRPGNALRIHWFSEDYLFRPGTNFACVIQ